MEAVELLELAPRQRKDCSWLVCTLQATTVAGLKLGLFTLWMSSDNFIQLITALIFIS
jgi:hypothetical protein